MRLPWGRPPIYHVVVRPSLDEHIPMDFEHIDPHTKSTL
jgi:hypothetical protein